MKKKCIAAIFLVTLSVFFVLAQTQKTNIVLLVDTSGTMLSYYKETNSRILTEISKEFIRTGDTVHLISFSKEPQIEFTQTIQTQKDVKKLTEQCSLLFPIGIHADLLSAVAYSEKYIESLEKNSRKILVIITDGKNNPPAGSQYYPLSAEKTEAELQNKITQLKGKNILTYIAKAPYKTPDALTSSKIAVIDNSVQNFSEQIPAAAAQENPSFQADAETASAYNGSPNQPASSLPQAADSKTADTQKQRNESSSSDEKTNSNTEINRKYEKEEAEEITDYEKSTLASNAFSQPKDEPQQPPEIKSENDAQSVPDNSSEFSQQLPADSKPADFFEAQNSGLNSDSVNNSTSDKSAAADIEDFAKENESAAAATAPAPRNSKQSKTTVSDKNKTPKTKAPRNQDKKAQKQQKQSHKSIPDAADSSAARSSFNKNYLFIAAAVLCGIILLLILIMILVRLRNRKNIYAQKKTAASDSAANLAEHGIKRSSSMPQLTAAAKQNNSMPVLDGSVKKTSSMPTLNSMSAETENKQTGKNNLLKTVSEPNGSKTDTQNEGKQNAASYRPANSTEIIDQKGTDSITLEMTVDKQNRNIGLRNVQTLVPGSRKSVGGGFSAFSIFVVQVPASIAEIRYDGVSCSLAIFQPQFFPHEHNAVIENCVGRPVIVRAANGFEMKLLFTEYKSKTEALNELLLSVIPDENKKRYLHN
ncbi:MAG: VWA domain-containing protein [Bacteroides sp.]|nr:VWA domain-containing protein [Prevotella sp.]MCM1407955.1 VWA domain-containing protein [Treponema brennaborense]MCM1469697.1 VWA domain-containing protein [Bacteroides sp.]